LAIANSVIKPEAQFSAADPETEQELATGVPQLVEKFCEPVG